MDKLNECVLFLIAWRDENPRQFLNDKFFSN